MSISQTPEACNKFERDHQCQNARSVAAADMLSRRVDNKPSYFLLKKVEEVDKSTPTTQELPMCR